MPDINHNLEITGKIIDSAKGRYMWKKKLHNYYSGVIPSLLLT